MELIFLGTSAGTITTERNVSAIVLNLIKERNALWLFDCGEATQHQMLKANLSLTKLENIFITHLHGDHLFGLPGVLTTRSLMQNMSPLTLFGPKGIKQFIQTVIDISYSWLTYPLNIIEIEQPIVLLDNEQFTVSCDALQHRVPCFGYRIVEKDHPAKLDVAKLKANNVPVGSFYSELKLGKTVQLDDGRLVDGNRYLCDIRPGKKIAILGDTIPCEAAIRLASNVDLLVHEATQKHDLIKKANERGHSTTYQAADIAKQSRAKKLVITHISPRYCLKDSLSIIEECQQLFPNSEIATDFYRLQVE